MFDWFTAVFNTLHDYMMSSVIGITNDYFGGSVVFFVLTVVCFSLLAMKKDQMQAGYKLFFAFTMVCLIGVVYNPIRLPIIESLLDNKDHSFIMFALCPFFAVIAYVLACSCSSVKKPVWRYVITVALALLIVFAGSSASYMNLMREHSNKYKINQNALEIADQVLNLSDGQPSTMYILVPPVEDESTVEGGTIAAGILQYTAFINVYQMPEVDGHWIDYYLSDVTPEGIPTEDYLRDYVGQAFEDYDLDYYAVPINDNVDSKMQNIGYARVGEAGGYYIYSLAAD